MSISNDIRRQVQARAQQRCEYCRVPDLLSTYTFHIDHIIALKHRGTDELENLAWACHHCNLHKGSDISSYDAETNALTRLYNPRSDNWQDHFSLNGIYLTSDTAIGRVTIHVLQMNHPDQLRIRQALLDADVW